MRLSSKRTDAYLARLGLSQVRLDPDGLAALQVAHLRAVPFHNLLLLANDAAQRPLPPIEGVVDSAIEGIGGNCDRTSPPFTVLLGALGFDATLAAATVGEPGDHFVCVVRCGGRRWLCDVGNGHPYLKPWDLDGPVQEQAFCGWCFRFDPQAPGGPTLFRHLPDGRVKRVYSVDVRARRYRDFASIVEGHYTRSGFGPFLNSLRAVRIEEGAVQSLRDAVFARDTPLARVERYLQGPEALRLALTERFAMPSDLVDQALNALLRRRPELFARPAWFSLASRPDRDEVPDVLVSYATVGRPVAEARLLRTLEEEARDYPGRVGVLRVANHAALSSPPETTLPLAGFHIDALRGHLRQAAAAGVLPCVDGVCPVPIGAAREAQLAALHRHVVNALPQLPHPSKRPTVVWMVDDDLAFQQLGLDGSIGRHTPLLQRVARAWASLPQVEVALGTFTGDPPIPGLDGSLGQLGDLFASLTRMLEAGPDAPWRPIETPPDCFDAYYDLTESPRSRGHWPYAPDRAGQPVREVAGTLLAEIPGVLDGRQLTRPLTWNGAEREPTPSLRRGGNTVYLEFDALFRWPTPVLRCADGVMTRRSDTLWAALAQRDGGRVAELTLPLLHGREGQAHTPGTAAGGPKTAAQLRGTVLARAVAEGRGVDRELEARTKRVRTQRAAVVTAARGLHDRLDALRAWGLDGDLAQDALAELIRRAQDSVWPGSDPRELQSWVDGLGAAVQRWRGVW